MVVADAVLVASRRTGGLNAPQQAFVDQDAECVVDRLARDGADIVSGGLGDIVSGAVGAFRHGLEYGQPLRRHLHTMLA